MSIDDKLKALEQARAELESKIQESEDILRDINEKMDDLQDRQRLRMRADERVDNKVVEAIHSQDGAAGITNANTQPRTGNVDIPLRKSQTPPTPRPGFGSDYDTGPLIKKVLTSKDVHVARKPEEGAQIDEK